jgi:hypothetical protein
MKHASLFVSSMVLSMVLAGCARKPDDGKVSAEIQSKFSQDSGLSSKQLTVKADNGVVTIEGNVDNDAQRQAAGRQAASVAGVKTVINNLHVGASLALVSAAAPAPAKEMKATAAPVTTAPPAKPKPGVGMPARKARETAKAVPQATTAEDPADQTDASSQPDPPAAAPESTPTPVADNTPAPPPSPKRLIIDQGTQLAVRLIDPIDSEKNQTGDTFHATLNTALTSDGEEAVPAGVEIVGHLVEVKSAGKFAGQSSVSMQLDKLSTGGKTYDLQTDQYKKEGSSRGKNTAAKVGGGAILGGIIGAIAGGGKGAAIGTAAGAGAGGGVQAAGKSEQIKFPSETVLTFTLQEPIEVVQAPKPDADRPKLSN